MLSAIEVARQTFLLQLRSKLYWLLVALSLGFASIFLFMPPNAGRVGGDLVFGLACAPAFTIVFPFIALYMAVHAVSGDLEDRTSVYLFTRPVHRAWILLGKWFAATLLGSLFTVFALTALYLAIAHTGRDWKGGEVPSAWNYGVFVLAGCLSSAGYAAMGCLFSAFFRRPMLVSMIYILVQEFASRMPPEAGIHAATVGDAIRRFAAQSLEDPGRGIKNFLLARIGQEDDVVGLDLHLGNPLLALLKLLVVVMLLATWIYSRREYDARPRE